MQEIKDILKEEKVFKGLGDAYLELISGCASNVRFNQGDYLFHQGETATGFYLLRHGRVSIDIFVPHKGAVTVQTVSEGELLGWSWLFPPYQRYYDAHAIVLTRAIAFEAECLREKCDNDPKLGYELMKRFAQVMVDRLRNTRVQLLDVYGNAK